MVLIEQMGLGLCVTRDSYAQTAADELRELQRDMSDVERLRSELALYFCDDEATFKLDDCIKTFSAFFASFAKAIEVGMNVNE